MNKEKNTIHPTNRKHYRDVMNIAKIDEEIVDKNFDFVKERNFIADKYGYKKWDIRFELSHPCGDICIFAGSVWMGHVDDALTEDMRDFYSNKA